MFFENIYDSWEKKQLSKYKKMLPLIKEMDLSSSLDIGANKGYFERFLENEKIKANIIRIDKNKYKNCIRMDAHDLKFEKNKFTSIFCIDTIHLINNTNEIKRVLRKNGKILVSIFFNKSNLEKRKKMLNKKFFEFEILNEIIHRGKENEIIRLIKPQQRRPKK